MTVEKLIAVLKSQKDKQAVVKCLDNDGNWLPVQGFVTATDGSLEIFPIDDPTDFDEEDDELDDEDEDDYFDDEDED